ncbi:MAG: ABC transporter substrate-binding protein [Methanomicrobiaceae archaeon]|nr:ABC transporter substrate-binding protein [Methanomicrobiaceae archaeon]
MGSRGATLTLLFICALMLIAGCVSPDRNQGNTSDTTITITDFSGIPVQVPADVHRVVSLSPSETEIFYELNTPDSGIELVGRTDYDNYPAEVVSVPSMGGPKTLSIDAIIRAEPDLVLASTVTNTDITAQLAQLGIPVLTYQLENFDDVYDNIRSVGVALGCEERAESLVASMRQRVAAVSNGSRAAEPPKVMYIVSAVPMYVAGAGTLQDEMITLCGATNIFHDKTRYFAVSEEAIISRSPDIILMPLGHGSGSYTIKADLLKKGVFSEIPAIMSGRLYELDENVVSRPGPRIVLALEMFDECITAG